MKYLWIVAVLVLTACGGGPAANVTAPQTPPNVAGPWEVTVTSSSAVDGASTLIETDLTQTTGAVTSTDASIFQSSPSQAYFTMGGSCPGNSVNTVSMTVAGSGSLQFNFSEGGNPFSGQGSATTSQMSGTYTSTGTGCTDSGSWTAVQTKPLTTSFAGYLTFPDGHHDYVTTNYSSTGTAVTITGTLTGDDSGTFSLSGSAIGNSVLAFGTVTINGSPTTATYQLFYSTANKTMTVFEPGGASDGVLAQM